MLEMNFPEIIPYLRKDKKIPISGVLLKQVANRQTDWDDHGTPILLRGLKTLMHEEKLTASQDGVAERLYSPLILAKLGIQDLGDGQGPWVPTPEELEAVRDDMDTALSADFRLLVHHFGLDVENVFGREQMPRLGDDFDRIERRLMQIFGVNPSLLSAGANSQPYASSALQAEFLNQILRTFQGRLKNHFRERALVVAEAHGHYAYETRGDTRVPIMEEVLITDPETGEMRKERRNKLLVPTLEFSTFDLRDEATERQFLQQMRSMGVPIPDNKMMIGVEEDISEMADEFNDELVEKTIAQQEAKVKAYKALTTRNLPVPPDLKAEVESVLGGGPVPGQEMGAGGPPGGGGAPPPPKPPGGGMGGPAMGGPGGLVMPPPPGGMPGMPGMPGAGPTGQPPVPGGGPPPRAPNGQVGNGFAPPASFERRPGMPTASSVQKKASLINVDWDDDGEATPSLVEVPLEVLETELDGQGAVADWLSDNYGWMVNGWSFVDEPEDVGIPRPGWKMDREGSSPTGTTLSLELVCSSSEVDPEAAERQQEVADLLAPHGIHVDVTPSLQNGINYSDAYVRFEPEQMGPVIEALQQADHEGDILDVYGPVGPEVLEEAARQGWSVETDHLGSTGTGVPYSLDPDDYGTGDYYMSSNKAVESKIEEKSVSDSVSKLAEASDSQLRDVERTDDETVEKIREPIKKKAYSFIEDPDKHPIEEDEVDSETDAEQKPSG